jgi:hypothetical protein
MKCVLFLKKALVILEKIVLLQRFLSLRPAAAIAAASKRFHKFWFLVLENPSFLYWGFLVLSAQSNTTFTAVLPALTT